MPKRLLRSCLYKLLCLAGLILLLFSFSVVLDIISYHANHEGKKVARVSSSSIGPQQFLVSVQEPGQTPEVFQIYGDMWQLDLKMLTWRSVWSLLGLKPMYKLDRLSGRYQSIEDERNRQRSLYSLSGLDGQNKDLAGFALWWSEFNHWLFAYQWLPGVESVYGGATFLPMTEGGEYSVYLYPRGLEAKAENEAAKAAVAHWGQ